MHARRLVLINTVAVKVVMLGIRRIRQRHGARRRRSETDDDVASLIHSRCSSTQPLFHQPLGKPAGMSVAALCEPDSLVRSKQTTAHLRIVALRKLDNLIERRHVAIHREDAIGRDEPCARRRSFAKLLLEVRHVKVVVPGANGRA